MCARSPLRGCVKKLLSRLGMPSWIVLLVLSAVLFLVGSTSFGLGGASGAARLGVLGAIAAVAVILAFSG